VDHRTGGATAIYDYHRAGTAGEVAGEPAWRRHGARYAPTFSKAWERWRAAEGKDLDMATFAHRLEDTIFDVVAPGGHPDWDDNDPRIVAVREALGGEPGSPSQLMTLSRNLEINAQVNVAEARRLSSGESQLVYGETHRDGTGAPVKVPGWFVISLPVFHGGGHELVPVRLRYRLAQGRVLWQYDLYRVEQVLLDAVMQVVEELSALPIPIFLGEAEPAHQRAEE
jgi:hypothetical protein